MNEVALLNILLIIVTFEVFQSPINWFIFEYKNIEVIFVTPETSHKFKLPRLVDAEYEKQFDKFGLGIIGTSSANITPAKPENAPRPLPVSGIPPN